MEEIVLIWKFCINLNIFLADGKNIGKIKKETSLKRHIEIILYGFQGSLNTSQISTEINFRFNYI